MFIFNPEQCWNIMSKVSTFFSDNRSDNIHVASSTIKLILISQCLSIIIPLIVESLLTLLANVSITMINR